MDLGHLSLRPARPFHLVQAVPVRRRRQAVPARLSVQLDQYLQLILLNPSVLLVQLDPYFQLVLLNPSVLSVQCYQLILLSL